MPSIRLYHVRTLVWTYLAWAFPNLWYATKLYQAVHDPAGGIPYFWALLQIAPVWASLADSSLALFGLQAVVGALSSIVAGLLIKAGWARVLIIVGMSLWFVTSWILLGIGV